MSSLRVFGSFHPQCPCGYSDTVVLTPTLAVWSSGTTFAFQNLSVATFILINADHPSSPNLGDRRQGMQQSVSQAQIVSGSAQVWRLTVE